MYGIQTNTDGGIFHDWLLTTANLDTLKIESPSRITPTSEPFIDLIMNTNQLFLEDPRRAITGLEMVDCNSDHKAIILEISKNNILIEDPEKLIDFKTK